MKILVFGAGAVGGSVAAWLSPYEKDLYVFDTASTVEAIAKNGITVYPQGNKAHAVTAKVKSITSLAAIDVPDVILLAVKNYSLDSVGMSLRNAYGDKPVIVALQNGVENQKILPKYFSKVIYAVVSYNAWVDAPGMIGYQKRGPLVLGTPRNELQLEMHEVARILNQGVATEIAAKLADATHSKMIINLTNSLTTLIGHTVKPISDQKLFQKILTNLTFEGVQIVKAAGFKECKLGGMPSWRLMRAAAKLPTVFTKRAFQKNVKKMVLSSMAQDVLLRGSSDSELETLNGYFLKLADQFGVKAPFNRVVYALCKERFAQPNFHPMDVRDVWEKCLTSR